MSNFLTSLLLKFSSKFPIRLLKGKVVTRIAPSPTGLFHFGLARTALFNFLFAQKYGGSFIVRIEDTDEKRNKKEFEKDILDGLAWLGLSYDNLFRQSERKEVYTKYLSKLINSGKAYISKEESTAKEKKGEQVEVVRLKNKGEKILFHDEIHGDIEFDTTELGDFVIARSVTEPLYHLAVVVDDYEMEVTHVIRGEDHISNTPRQILIQRALGIPQPVYAHIPLILAPDRSKLSKRDGSTSITEYRENGYLSLALINYLAFLGWNPGTDKEVYTLKELIHDFSLEKVQKGSAIFDNTKLNWFNKEHLRLLSREKILEIFERALPEKTKNLPQYSNERLGKMTETLVERIETLKELTILAERRELDYFFSSPAIEIKLSWKEDGREITKKHLLMVIEKLEVLSPQKFGKENIKDANWSYAEEIGKGSVLWPMRVALSGKEKSPDPFVIAEILGKEETLSRLTRAIKTLE